jgi:hypothetical protein
VGERTSEFERQDDEAYWTPAWVVNALLKAHPDLESSWDCAPRNRGDFDFLQCPDWLGAFTIVTNPPYGKGGALAGKFIRHALKTAPVGFKLAMLLPMAFDAGKTRVDVFRDCPTFAGKYVMLPRIRWENLPQSDAGPSQNHAWFIWRWDHTGAPKMGWLTDA